MEYWCQYFIAGHGASTVSGLKLGLWSKPETATVIG